MPVTGFRSLIVAAALPALAACGGDCGSRLVVVNASGQAIASGSLRSPGPGPAVSMASLPSPGAAEYRFQEVEEGAYAVELRFADGSSRRDTALGYLTRGMAFRDTLFVRPSGAKPPLQLKQAPEGCREAPRMKTVVREILKKVF